MEGRLIVSPWIRYKTGCVSLGVMCVSWVPALLCPGCFNPSLMLCLISLLVELVVGTVLWDEK